MTRLFGVAAGPASAYAVVNHAAQLVLYTITGFICLIAQGRGLRTRIGTPERPDPSPLANETPHVDS
jgi:hypothetical protein